MINPGFQITLNVQGRPCVVLGGDDEAADKVIRLLDAGAKVTIIHPSLNEALRKMTASGTILHRGRLFRSSDIDGAVLVVNTLKTDREEAKSLFDLAQKTRCLLWSRDQPEFSTVLMPALVKRGHLRMAVSTSGVAPGLASRLRRDLEQVFDDRFVHFLNWLGEFREQAKDEEKNAESRRAQLDAAVEDFKLLATVHYPKMWVDSGESRQN
jgi:precorrin-2 dehydrogenase/sirohydrochlorin ferrochelatase